MLGSMLKLAQMRVKEYMYYKSSLILYTINRVVEVVIYIFVWYAIYNETGEISGFTIDEISTYYILVVSLIPIMLWGINEDMAISIRNGQINRELLNPISYFKYYFGIELGEIFFGLMVACVTFIICNIFWVVILPQSLINIVLFLIILIINIPIVYFTQVIVGLFGLYSNSIWGMQILRKSIISIFSGLIAPITMFPLWFQKIIDILPFKEFIYTPINMYLGRIELNQIPFIIIKQLVWAVIFYVIARNFFSKVIKNITINGG